VIATASLERGWLLLLLLPSRRSGVWALIMPPAMCLNCFYLKHWVMFLPSHETLLPVCVGSTVAVRERKGGRIASILLST
jgi:hypothetical protein